MPLNGLLLRNKEGIKHSELEGYNILLCQHNWVYVLSARLVPKNHLKIDLENASASSQNHMLSEKAVVKEQKTPWKYTK